MPFFEPPDMNEDEKKECCGNCRHYLPDTETDGRCRRYPPRRTITRKVDCTVFPHVERDQYCWEFLLLRRS